MHLDDAAAVVAAAGGDEDAFRVLVERHSRSVFRLAYRMTGSAQDAEDVVQETFVRAYRQLARFESRSNFSTWLYRIGFNCSIDHLRGRDGHVAAKEPEVLDRLSPPDTGPTSEDLVFAGQIGQRVQQALNGLSAQERAAFLMRHYHGCSIDDICHALGLKANAAKHSIFRAVKKMRAELQPFVRPRMERLQDNMHPSDDELIEHLSGDTDPAVRARLEAHLRECGECRRTWADLSAALTIVDGAVPEPPAGFERVMWARVSQAIAQEKGPAGLWSWRHLVPAGALVAAVVVAAVAGRAGTLPAPDPSSSAALADNGRSIATEDLKAEIRQDERVLFTALDEHLQQAETLLIELRNAPDRDSLSLERTTADDLVSAGRLYRQTAEYTGQTGVVRMLDDLEPVLVEVARSPQRMDEQNRQWLRARIDDDNLLFKVRAIATDIRERTATTDKGDQK